jgi:hypothetical protein
MRLPARRRAVREAVCQGKGDRCLQLVLPPQTWPSLAAEPAARRRCPERHTGRAKARPSGGNMPSACRDGRRPVPVSESRTTLSVSLSRERPEGRRLKRYSQKRAQFDFLPLFQEGCPTSLVAQLLFHIAGPKRDPRDEQRPGRGQRDRIEWRRGQRRNARFVDLGRRSGITPVSRPPKAIGKLL